MHRFVFTGFADEISPDLKVQMDVLATLGIRHIEMRGVNGKNLVQNSLNEVGEIKKQLDERGFKVSAVGSPIGKISITDDFIPHLDLFKHALEIAGVLETKYIRMFSFFIPESMDPAVFRGEVMNRWEAFIRAAAGTNITLLHENEKNIYGDTPERCLDLLSTMNCSYMKAVFDPANFVQCDVETYPKAYGLLRDYIVYMHIKDALYSDASVVPAGYGDGQLGNILKELKGDGYEGYLSLEPHLDDFPGFADLERKTGRTDAHKKAVPIRPEVELKTIGDLPVKDDPVKGAKLFSIAYEALAGLLEKLE